MSIACSSVEMIVRKALKGRSEGRVDCATAQGTDERERVHKWPEEKMFCLIVGEIH